MRAFSISNCGSFYIFEQFFKNYYDLQFESEDQQLRLHINKEEQSWNDI
jgi:hypothetical protein